jgi:flagellar protein FlaG
MEPLKISGLGAMLTEQARRTPHSTVPAAQTSGHAVPPAPTIDPVIDAALLGSLVWEMNEALRTIDTSLEFSLHEDSGRIVVRVIDSDNGDLIRQFPSAEALSIAEALTRLQGALIKDQA